MIGNKDTKTQKLSLAPWIKAIEGIEQVVIYNFKDKKVLSLSKDSWLPLLDLLPASFQKIKKNLIKISSKKYTWYIENFIHILQSNSILIPVNQILPNYEKPKCDDEILHSLSPLVTIEVTSKCNFKCLHCYLGEDKHSSFELSLPALKQIANELKALNVTEIQITGGEPLLLKDISQILNIFIEDFKIHLNTNGSILKKELIPCLKNMESVQVGIYGFTETSFEKFTRYSKSIFNDIILNILQLLDNEVKVILAYAVIPENAQEVEEFINFCRKYNVKYSLGFTLPVGDALICRERVLVNLAFKKHILERYLSHDHHIVFKRYACAPTKLAILSNGNITPCQMLRTQFILGNIYSHSIVSVWNNSMNEFRKQVDLEHRVPCCFCEFRYICGGVCPAYEREFITGPNLQDCKIYNSKELISRKTLDFWNFQIKVST